MLGVSRHHRVRKDTPGSAAATTSPGTPRLHSRRLDFSLCISIADHSGLFIQAGLILTRSPRAGNLLAKAGSRLFCNGD